MFLPLLSGKRVFQQNILNSAIPRVYEISTRRPETDIQYKYLMNEELELHDSDISYIDESGDRLKVTFSEAYIWSYGEGWGQCAIFSLGKFEITSRPLKLPLRISSGKLYGKNDEFNSVIEVPLSITGKYRFELLFSNGEMLKVSGNDPIGELFGERRFIENVPPV